jgi:hypothetical protein
MPFNMQGASIPTIMLLLVCVPCFEQTSLFQRCHFSEISLERTSTSTSETLTLYLSSATNRLRIPTLANFGVTLYLPNLNVHRTSCPTLGPRRNRRDKLAYTACKKRTCLALGLRTELNVDFHVTRFKSRRQHVACFDKLEGDALSC